MPLDVSKTTTVSPKDFSKICKVFSFRLKRFEGVLTNLIQRKKEEFL
jgi:hypothetical protein